MSVIAGAPVALLLVLLLALLAAAGVDVVRRHIPNTAVVAVAISGIAAFIATGQSALLWQPALAALAIVLVGAPMFARGWLGGGDVKLLAATAFWFHWPGNAMLVASVLLAGGALALAVLLIRLAKRQPISRNASEGIPYAVAISLGACLQVWLNRF